MIHLIKIWTFAFIFISCQQNEAKQKELEQKERELRIKEKELDQRDSLKVLSSNADAGKSDNTAENSNYNFEEHGDFNAFFKDFKHAVISSDKEAVIKMTHFPFRDLQVDAWQEQTNEQFGKKGDYSKSMTSKSKEEFLKRYNQIFTPLVIKALNDNKFRGWSKEMAEDEFGPGEDVIEKVGERLLETKFDSDANNRQLIFKKYNRKYMLDRIPYYP